MNIKQTLKRIPRSPLFFAGFFIAIFAAGLQAPPVSAYCVDGQTNYDAGNRHACWRDNYRNLESQGKTKGVGEEQYYQMVESCYNSTPLGSRGGVNNARCANAAMNCIQWSTEPNRCSDGRYTNAIVDECNAGKLTSNTGCGPIEDANAHYLEEQRKRAEDELVKTCNTPDPLKKNVDEAACRALASSVAAACAGQKDRFGYVSNPAAYQQCMDRNIISKSPDKVSCEKRGGRWLDADAGGVSKGCHLYSDLTNSEACTAGGGKFVVVGKNNGQDTWGCIDPKSKQAQCIDQKGQWNGTTCMDTEEACKLRDPKNTWDQTTDPKTGQVIHKCSDGGGGLTNADGSNTGTGTITQAGKCGQARTNLIGCTGTGVQAIGDVLRQIITILSILIGIAAVGGIAYAAVQYASATDNSTQTKNAIDLIRNIVIGILVYGFMVAIINWLIPGGVIG